MPAGEGATVDYRLSVRSTRGFTPVCYCVCVCVTRVYTCARATSTVGLKAPQSKITYQHASMLLLQYSLEICLRQVGHDCLSGSQVARHSPQNMWPPAAGLQIEMSDGQEHALLLPDGPGHVLLIHTSRCGTRCSNTTPSVCVHTRVHTPAHLHARIGHTRARAYTHTQPCSTHMTVCGTPAATRSRWGR